MQDISLLLDYNATLLVKNNTTFLSFSALNYHEVKFLGCLSYCCWGSLQC